MLYLTGYLTKARNEQTDEVLPDGAIALMIPNEEIRDIFETTVIQWFDDSTRKWNRTLLFDAVWNGDSVNLTKEMNILLRRTISYHDYKEDFYHAFLAGIFTGAGYMVDSNKEHGEGRSDVVVYDPVNGRVAIFEAKYTKNQEKLESTCNTALQQIDERLYAKEYEDDYDQILCYGISFFKNGVLSRKSKRLSEEIYGTDHTFASASPRRKELLEQIGLEFEICPAKGEEVISKSAPEEVVMELSEQKATEVAAMVKTYESGHGELMTPQDILVIGADTVVACDDTILGKPKDEADAKRMLTLLSGRKHAVYTGVTFVFLDKTDERAHIPLRENRSYHEAVVGT